MDLLANDLAAIFSLLAALLSVIAAALPFFKNCRNTSMLAFKKTSEKYLLGIIFKNAFGYILPYKFKKARSYA